MADSDLSNSTPKEVMTRKQKCYTMIIGGWGLHKKMVECWETGATTKGEEPIVGDEKR